MTSAVGHILPDVLLRREETCCPIINLWVFQIKSLLNKKKDQRAEERSHYFNEKEKKIKVSKVKHHIIQEGTWKGEGPHVQSRIIHVKYRSHDV